MTKIKRMWERLSSAMGSASSTPEYEHIQIDESYTAHVKPDPGLSRLGEFLMWIALKLGPTEQLSTLKEPLPPTKFAVMSDGTRIAYVVQGSGNPVILLPGASCDKSYYFRYGLAAMLVQSGFQVICLDGLAHCESDAPTDWEYYLQKPRAAGVVSVMDAEGIQTAHMIGYSMGSWTICAVAQFFPDRILSAIIGGWSPGVSRPAVLAGISTETWIKVFKSAVVGNMEWYKESMATGFGHVLMMFYRDVHGQEEALAALDVPVVIWTGSKDHDHRNTREMVKKHGWRTIVIENADHNKASQSAEQVASMLKKIIGATGM